jgi:hypothetical protein
MEDREWTSVLIPSILYHCSKEFAPNHREALNCRLTSIKLPLIAADPLRLPARYCCARDHPHLNLINSDLRHRNLESQNCNRPDCVDVDPLCANYPVAILLMPNPESNGRRLDQREISEFCV